MTWAKLDDRFHSHPKVEEAGLAATGLYARSLSYAACHETDGQIPEAWVKKQGSPRLAARLTDLGLWERVEGGWLIPDFTEFNPSKAELAEQRKQWRERQRRSRGGSR